MIPEIRPDGRQSETALMIQRGVCRMLRETGFACLTEFTLATGRRADVIGIGSRGEIWIVEIKSSPEDFRADRKWHDYHDYCDRLFFAIPIFMEQRLIPETSGLIVADAHGALLLRHPEVTPLPGPRRKALTLAFGRTAALRLHGLHDPAGNS